MRAAGLALAVVGIVLASREDDEGTADPRLQRLSIVLAIVAGLGFGSYFVLAEIGSSGDVGWALAAVAHVGVSDHRGDRDRRAAPRRRAPGRRELAILAGIGLLDLGANFFYNYASTIGELSSVAVASSLYPVTTVMLAALWLGERVQGVQRAGVVVALMGVVLIAAGGLAAIRAPACEPGGRHGRRSICNDRPVRPEAPMIRRHSSSQRLRPLPPRPSPTPLPRPPRASWRSTPPTACTPSTTARRRSGRVPSR